MRALDKFGRELTAGDFIGYPQSTGSSSAEIKIGRVITVERGGAFKWSVKVIGLSRGRLQKPSVIRYPERCIVLPMSLLPSDVLTIFGVDRLAVALEESFGQP